MTDKPVDTLILVAKVPGDHSKTRLAPRLGRDGARRLAEAMLGDLAARLGAADELRGVAKLLLHAPPDAAAAARLGALLRARGVAEGAWSLVPMAPVGDLASSDLGAKLEGGLAAARARARGARGGGVAFVGMDTPDLPARAVADAFAATALGRAFVCPAEDGGCARAALALSAAPPHLRPDAPRRGPRG